MEYSDVCVAFVSDICQLRFRYLSASFQISVSFVSDICQFRFRCLLFAN